MRIGKKERFTMKVENAEGISAIRICGSRPGPCLVVTAGVHGCEYVGIQAAYDLVEELEPDKIRGEVIVVPVMNDAGFFAGARQINPKDGVNLNRAFPGNAEESVTYRIASAIEKQLYPLADFLIDLHGGDCNEALNPLVFFPVAASEEICRRAEAAAKALEVPYRVASAAKNGLYSYANQCGIPALLLERGGLGRWTQQEVADCKNNVYQLMRHLGQVDECASDLAGVQVKRAEDQMAPQTLISEAFYLEAPDQGFWYPHASCGQRLKMGEILGIYKSADRTHETVFRAPFDGVVLYYTVSLGVSREDSLMAFGKRESC